MQTPATRSRWYPTPQVTEGIFAAISQAPATNRADSAHGHASSSSSTTIGRRSDHPSRAVPTAAGTRKSHAIEAHAPWLAQRIGSRHITSSNDAASAAAIATERQMNVVMAAVRPWREIDRSWLTRPIL